VTLGVTPWSGVLLASNEQQYSITKNWSMAKGGELSLTDQAISIDTAGNSITLLPVTALQSLGVKSGSGVKENELKKRYNDFGGTGSPSRKDPTAAPLVCAIRMEFNPPSN
jgi:hypothetical protein